MKKIVILLLILALLGAIGFGLYRNRVYQETYITIHGVEYRRDTRELSFSIGLPDEPEAYAQLTQVETIDLRQARVSAEEYDRLRIAMPEAEIFWNIPFQGNAYPQDTTELTLTDLSPEDLELLAYFSALERIDAEQCEDFEAILALLARYPHLDIRYRVPLGTGSYPRDVQELDLTDADAAQLELALAYLPEVRSVRLEGRLPQAEALSRLRENFPQVEFYWQMELFGQAADVNTRQIDLSGIPMTSTQELEAAVAYLPALEKVLMLDCGLSSEEMAALNSRHEDILFVWNVNLNNRIILRSDAEIFAPVLYYMEVSDRDLVNLKYCTELVLIDLGHMHITDISFLENMTKLEYLILADTRIQDLSPMENLKSLRYLEIFMTGARDYSPLLHCTALEDLNLGLTFGAPEPLMEMTWLNNLWWAAHDMTDAQVAALQEALPDTRIVFPSYGSTGDGWRDLENYFRLRDMMGMPYLTE